MKMHGLVVAVLVALASRAAMAESEGGDTYSAVQETQRAPRSAPFIPRIEAAAAALDAGWGGAEGGDTWLRLQDWHKSTPRYASRHGDDAVAAGATEGSEGGDTFSRFVPAPQGNPVSAPRIASVPAL